MIKITKYPPNYGAQRSPFAYLNNLEFQNSLFGDDLLFEGLLETPSGFAIVTSQPFIEGNPASQVEIDQFFDSLGFEALGNFTYRNISTSETTHVFDCRPDNIFRASDNGNIYPIDIQIKLRPTKVPLNESFRNNLDQRGC